MTKSATDKTETKGRFPNNLEAILDAIGMKQATLAASPGLDTASVNRWLKWRRRIPLDKLELLMKAIPCTYEDMFTEDFDAAVFKSRWLKIKSVSKATGFSEEQQSYMAEASVVVQDDRLGALAPAGSKIYLDLLAPRDLTLYTSQWGLLSFKDGSSEIGRLVNKKGAFCMELFGKTIEEREVTSFIPFLKPYRIELPE